MYDILQLNDMLVPELKEIASQLGIKGYHKLTKQDIIYRILDEQALVEKKSGGDKVPVVEEPAPGRKIVVRDPAPPKPPGKISQTPGVRAKQPNPIQHQVLKRNKKNPTANTKLPAMTATSKIVEKMNVIVGTIAIATSKTAAMIAIATSKIVGTTVIAGITGTVINQIVGTTVTAAITATGILKAALQIQVWSTRMLQNLTHRRMTISS